MADADPKVTIQEIMYQAGFNSKSSFNKEFKKLNGVTPTEYRRSVQ
jgi:AraC-like DNA-binding protein